jgi:hypothetical protein
MNLIPLNNKRFFTRMIPYIVEPQRITRKFLNLFKIFNIKDFNFKLAFDLFRRSEYAYGTYYSAWQAKSLGYESLSVIEFGIAGGKGLIELENISIEVEKIFNINIEVYGFDTGTGMPDTSDPRDLPYFWKKGFFKMDIDLLKSKLKKAKLIIGPISETIVDFINNHKYAPIGFVSFDMDYYTSTVPAMKILESKPESLIPRVFCYFDDTIGDDLEIHCDFNGEQLAINEFNNSHSDRKIGKINCLHIKRIFPAIWNEQMFVLHYFSHPDYCRYINPETTLELPL